LIAGDIVDNSRVQLDVEGDGFVVKTEPQDVAA